MSEGKQSKPKGTAIENAVENGAVQCGICLEAVQDGASLEGCNHRFCFECIIRWAHISGSPSACPLCRNVFELVRRSRGNELVVVMLHDGDGDSSYGAANVLEARVVAGRSMRQRRGNARSEALLRYSRQRADHLNSVAERLKLTRERIQRDRARRRRRQQPMTSISLKEHEEMNKEAMRRADPSSEEFKTLQGMQRTIEELKKLEAADLSDKPASSRVVGRKKRKRNGSYGKN